MSNSGKIWDVKEVYTLQRNNNWSRGDTAICCGGDTPSVVNTIDTVQISTTGNATDFGDLISVLGNGNAADFGDLTAIFQDSGSVSPNHGGIA